MFQLIRYSYTLLKGFPPNSASKESTCSAGNPGSLPGSGRSRGEGIVYSLQYSWALLAAQMVKNLFAMQETWVWSPGWEDPLEGDMATHCSILAWKIPWTKEPGYSPLGCRVKHDWETKDTHALLRHSFCKPIFQIPIPLTDVPRLHFQKSMVTTRKSDFASFVFFIHWLCDLGN